MKVRFTAIYKCCMPTEGREDLGNSESREVEGAVVWNMGYL